ncbi:unnamed protein product [Dovyalis caffra]|uniref:Uncharacterized protein n=1 Tax=Dovyalis caffra TaxID=77055 RepID=A0AAV1SD38_9ROSI|nr:unnamed protein product [Dovyalis caffra]
MEEHDLTGFGFKRLSEPTWEVKVTRFGKGWFGWISRDREVDAPWKREGASELLFRLEWTMGACNKYHLLGRLTRQLGVAEVNKKKVTSKVHRKLAWLAGGGGCQLSVSIVYLSFCAPWTPSSTSRYIQAAQQPKSLTIGSTELNLYWDA